ncbi:MAG: hypothetical protein P8M66_08025 [Flavobacteriaceae bacterium]|nr:hypothetical protein [Flavobacteriaceae bacterium]
MKRQGIFYKVFLKDQAILAIPQSPKTITGYAETIREVLHKHLEQLPFKVIERAFIKALLLGQRQDISSNVYEAYKKRGLSIF